MADYSVNHFQSVVEVLLLAETLSLQNQYFYVTHSLLLFSHVLVIALFHVLSLAQSIKCIIIVILSYKCLSQSDLHTDVE